MLTETISDKYKILLYPEADNMHHSEIENREKEKYTRLDLPTDEILYLDM